MTLTRFSRTVSLLHALMIVDKHSERAKLTPKQADKQIDVNNIIEYIDERAPDVEHYIQQVAQCRQWSVDQLVDHIIDDKIDINAIMIQSASQNPNYNNISTKE